jgi:hypothetical protein
MSLVSSIMLVSLILGTPLTKMPVKAALQYNSGYEVKGASELCPCNFGYKRSCIKCNIKSNSSQTACNFLGLWALCFSV